MSAVSTYRIEIRRIPCPACKGAGRFVLFTSVEACAACGGMGRVDRAHWVALDSCGNPERLYIQDGSGWIEVKE